VFFSNLRPHPNVVQVLGVSTDGINVVMIMEYCEEGKELYSLLIYSRY
jgi:serine/threonine protein kinase